MGGRGAGGRKDYMERNGNIYDRWVGSAWHVDGKEVRSVDWPHQQCNRMPGTACGPPMAGDWVQGARGRPRRL